MPKAATVAATISFTWAASGDVALDHQTLAAGRLDRAQGLFGPGHVDVGDGHLGAFLGEERRTWPVPSPSPPPVTMATRFSNNIAVSLSRRQVPLLARPSAPRSEPQLDIPEVVVPAAGHLGRQTARRTPGRRTL